MGHISVSCRKIQLCQWENSQPGDGVMLPPVWHWWGPVQTLCPVRGSPAQDRPGCTGVSLVDTIELAGAGAQDGREETGKGVVPWHFNVTVSHSYPCLGFILLCDAVPCWTISQAHGRKCAVVVPEGLTMPKFKLKTVNQFFLLTVPFFPN